MQFKISSALLLLALAGAAQANTTRFYSGTECQASTSVDNGYIARYFNGCTNLSPLTSVPTCGADTAVILPISGNNSDTVDFENVQLRYDDENAFKHISCAVGVTNSAGTVYQSTTQSSGDAFTGYGIFTWATTALPNSGNSISATQNQSLYCEIPSRWREHATLGCVLNFQSTLQNYRVEAVGS